MSWACAEHEHEHELSMSMNMSMSMSMSWAWAWAEHEHGLSMIMGWAWAWAEHEFAVSLLLLRHLPLGLSNPLLLLQFLRKEQAPRSQQSSGEPKRQEHNRGPALGLFSHMLTNYLQGAQQTRTCFLRQGAISLQGSTSLNWLSLACKSTELQLLSASPELAAKARRKTTFIW